MISLTTALVFPRPLSDKWLVQPVRMPSLLPRIPAPSDSPLLCRAPSSQADTAPLYSSRARSLISPPIRGQASLSAPPSGSPALTWLGSLGSPQRGSPACGGGLPPLSVFPPSCVRGPIHPLARLLALLRCLPRPERGVPSAWKEAPPAEVRGRILGRPTPHGPFRHLRPPPPRLAQDRLPNADGPRIQALHSLLAPRGPLDIWTSGHLDIWTSPSLPSLKAGLTSGLPPVTRPES
ncbi:uncharacterized protein LOC110220112 [Phascolarctos cinereus]